MLCVPIESQKSVLFLKVDNFDEILNLERISKQLLGRNLGALEMLDEKTFQAVIKNVEGITNPFREKSSSKNPLYLLIELSSNVDLSEIE